MDDEEDTTCEPTPSVADSLWIYSNHLRRCKPTADPKDDPTRRMHERHLHKDPDYLIGHNAPPRAGLKEMLIPCAGYSALHHKIITREGHKGTTPDTWLRLLHRRPTLDSPHITKIAGLHMPPHLMIALHALPAHAQQGIFAHLLSLAQCDAMRTRSAAPTTPRLNPNFLKRSC